MVKDDAVKVFESQSGLSREAAELVKRVAADSVRRRGRFNLVLSGGTTPRPLFKLLAREYRHAIAWRKTHVFWSDERYVAPDHRDSNFAAAEADLIQHVPIPATQVHRIPTDFRSHESAAIEYEVKLRSLFPAADAPEFDLVLLGLGGDGHTASLFPGQSPATDKWVAGVSGPDYRPPRDRITLTPAALNGARVAAFLVCGDEKHQALRSLLSGSRADLPAALIHPREELIWLVDRRAYGTDGSGEA